MQKKNFIDTVVPLVVIKRDILKGFVCVCFYSDFFFSIYRLFSKRLGLIKVLCDLIQCTVIAWCLIRHLVCRLWTKFNKNVCRLYWSLYYVEERQTFRDFNLGLTIYTIHYELVYYFTVANLAWMNNKVSFFSKPQDGV